MAICNLFDIAGIQVRTEKCLLSNNNAWMRFKIDAESQIDLSVKIINLTDYTHRVSKGKLEFLFVHGNVIRIGYETMLIDKDWKDGYILQPFNMQDASSFITMVFMTHAVRRHMLQIHCSIVEYKGVGILFLGPSGIGKTTQAERWAEYRNALIINGDIGYVEDTGNGFLAWGTPWHGSSPYCVNTSVPIVAMVVLKQAGENRLRRLSGFEMVTEVSGSVFYPTWLEDGMELCTATLNDLLTTVPVYLLENKADEEAVNMLGDELGLS